MPSAHNEDCGMTTPASPDTLTAGGSADDQSKIRWGALSLLFIAMVWEGFDLQAANYSTPDLIRSFGVTRDALTPVLSASLFGMLLGAPVAGMLGDRFGRKRVIIASITSYASLSALAAFSTSIDQLTLVRFIIGLGLGGALPNVLALATELMPSRARATGAALVGVGIPLGAVVAGAASAAMLPLFGWRSLFLIGGMGPLAVVLMLVLWLPESPSLLLARQAPLESGLKQPAREVSALFGNGQAPVTLSIWVTYIMLLMTVYLLSSWMPLLLSDAGFSVRGAALLTTGYHLGGVAGGVFAALLLGHRSWLVLAAFLASAGGLLMTLAWGGLAVTATAIALIACGFCVVGAQNGLNGATGVAYPAENRSTGLGWALGLGRLGSVAGPFVGGLAVSTTSSDASKLFALPLVPMGIAVLAVFMLHWRQNRS